MCYLDTNDKITCSGCEACANICPHKAICMIPDSEEFRYPKINIDLCTNCGLCRKVCPYNLSPQKYSGMNYTFGGHIKNQKFYQKAPLVELSLQSLMHGAIKIM
ncbi:MAG: NADH-quinone oxidoreductase subunit I [Coprococcus sp.]